MSAPRAFESVAVERLIPHPENPRRGNVDAVVESIRANGFYGALVVQRSTCHVLAGNHRLLAATQLGMTKVPVAWVDCDDETARRILVADNRSSDLAVWDDAALAALLRDIGDSGGLDGTLFSDDELDRLLRDLAGPAQGADDVPEPPEPVSVPGDLWLLGEHRLLCGDSTDEAVLVAALDGARGPLVFTDPPYGVNYDGGSVPRPQIMGDAAVGDELDALFAAPFAAAELAGATTVMVWYGGNRPEPMLRAVAAAGWEVRAQIIWLKNLAQFGTMGSQYHGQHEPCSYCVRPGRKPTWRGGSTETTVWAADRAPVNNWHPTQKPVALAERAVLNHSLVGEVIVDPFGGSGSTLIAAQRTNRRAVLVEKDPRYVDVICRRYQAVTGDLPVRDGQRFDFAEDAPVPAKPRAPRSAQA